jgi:hypothetical protein
MATSYRNSPQLLPTGPKIEVNRFSGQNLSKGDSTFFEKHLTKSFGFVKLESMRLNFEFSTR